MSAQKQSGIDEILYRWRVEIKGKKRRIISFEETVEIKINAIKALIFTDTEPIDGWECREFQYSRHREREFIGDWRPIKVGETWGGPDMSAMFRTKAAIPARFAGKKVVAKLYFGGDGLLSLNGTPYFGLDPFRDTVYLTESATGTEQYDMDIEAYIFWHFGESEIKTVESSQFAVMDQEMNDIYWDFKAAYNIMMAPKGQDPDLITFVKGVMAEAIEYIDLDEDDYERFRAKVRQGQAILREKYYSSNRFHKDGVMHLAAHSHIDVVFLWTHAEFVRKLGRTHATALRLIEQYPDYIFCQSQPLMYQEMKTTYPAMYEEVKQRIKEGRWESIGAFWVEPDCNLLSGESFVRQILHGVRFNEQEFGVTPRTCWCPDVFGNQWTMPQILKRAGLEYFVTHKMTVWNDTNHWNKHTFWWEGPDGSKILSLVPATHFIGMVEPDHMLEHWDNFSDKNTVGESLYNFGWGDGGGGPDAEMLEYVKRYRNVPGLPDTRPNTIEGALDSIAGCVDETEIPTVNDELYLEQHRGVHTTKARLKKLNRRGEFLYRKAELWSCFATRPYPQDTLDAGWKELLTNQFHDSLPGSHIPPVYLDLQEAYARIFATGEQVLADALSDITGRINTQGKGQAVVCFNALGTEREHTLVKVAIPEHPVHVLDPQGAEVPSQFVTDYETGARVLIFEAHVPAAGYAVYRMVDGAGALNAAPVAVTPTMLENDAVKLVLNGEGEVLSLVDKATGREMIDPKKKGNVLHLYEDIPGKYDAWDIAPSYTKVQFPIGAASVEVVEQGPVRAAIQFTRMVNDSPMTQRVTLARNGTRIEFQTWIDWKEEHKLLKTRFHTNLVSRKATFDIAYGNIERSTTRNNSFEAARFEVPAHQWMDLSQTDRGVSLMNDCKYGHEALEQMIALTILRAPKSPDVNSDMEQHWFTYALYPHAGTWREAQTDRAALDLNDPVTVVLADSHDGPLNPVGQFLTINTPNVTLEAVKKAEDSAALIIRVVEQMGGQDDVAITFPQAISAATEVNLLEREDQPVDYNGNRLTFSIKPYEIRSFKVTM